MFVAAAHLAASAPASSGPATSVPYLEFGREGRLCSRAGVDTGVLPRGPLIPARCVPMRSSWAGSSLRGSALAPGSSRLDGGQRIYHFPSARPSHWLHSHQCTRVHPRPATGCSITRPASTYIIAGLTVFCPCQPSTCSHGASSLPRVQVRGFHASAGRGGCPPAPSAMGGSPRACPLHAVAAAGRG